jgi:4-amino-4-deoxy-L-arabinose transferase-like glycosyltransferase
MYLLAGAFKVLGPGLFSLRSVSAAAGALAPPALFFVLRRPFPPAMATVAALLLAVSSWHVAISRFAMPYTLPTAAALPALFLLLRGLERGSRSDFLLAGSLLGLAQYGAQTARVGVLLFAFVVIDALLDRRGDPAQVSPRVRLRGTSLALGAALFVSAPLLVAAWHDPEAFVARARQVALLAGESAEGDYASRVLARNALAYAGAFNVQGDWNGRHHLPGAPLLDPVSGILAATGLFLALRSLRRPGSRLLLAWLLVALLPGLLSVDAPSALRTVEAAAPLYGLAALGGVALLDGLKVPGRWATTAASLLVVSAFLWNAGVYFVRMNEAPAVWRGLGGVGSRLGEAIASLEARGGIPAGSVLWVPASFDRREDDALSFRFVTASRSSTRVFERRLPDGPGFVALPNDAGLWRRVAVGEPGYESTAAAARREEERWRKELASREPTPVLLVTGPPFPGTDEASFWLFRMP